MENKYYTPELEDLHIGYECERKHYKNGIAPYELSQEQAREFYKNSEIEWSKEIIRSLFNYTHLLMDNEVIRTKYLDKEDIESLGWRQRNSSNIFEKDKTYLSFNIYSNIPVIEIFKNLEEKYIFMYIGECKSINELRKLMKWLKIN